MSVLKRIPAWPFRVIFVVMLLVLASMPAAAQGDAVLRPDPIMVGLKPGEQATVSLIFENVQDLYGVEVHLSFDPSLLEVVDADPGRSGVQIQAADWLKDAFVASNLASNTSGKIDFAATLLNPAPPVNGSKTIVTITFKAKQKGSTELAFVSAILATRDAEAITTEAQNGRITVSESGQAPVASAATSVPGSSGGAVDTQKSNTALLIVAGIAIAVFVAALVVLIIVLRRRRTE